MSGYIGNIPTPQATQTRETFTATASQTTFNTAGYTPGFVDVWLNGVKLVNGDDFTATNGSDVVLTVGAASGDTVEVLSFSTFEVNSQTFTGGLTVNNDGATVITADRATSDGSIVDFKKDGTTVGSIGALTGDMYLGTGDTGLYFLDSSDAIIPANPSSPSVSNGIVNLGQPSYRFKNLYLSGGVYLGGTGAANLLDDYEEGTWTPAATQGTIDYVYTWYVKTGETVTVSGYINTFSNRTSTANLSITGLPFTSAAGATSVGTTLSRYISLMGGDPVVYIGPSSSSIQLYCMDTSANYDAVQYNNLTSADAVFYFTITYKTT